jgi:hypothetical protein
MYVSTVPPGEKMTSVRKWLHLFSPNSGLGITMATFTVLGLLAIFFARDIQLVSLNAPLDKTAGLIADRALVLPSDSSKREVSNQWSEGHFDVFDNLEVDPSEAVQLDQSLRVAKLDPAASALVQPSGRYSSNPSMPAVIATHRVALLGRTSDCCWVDNDRKLGEGATIHVGQTLHIAAGLMEIIFGCGATAVLEGPAVLEVESDKSGTLRLGKLTANVPDQVEGFVVHTPSIQLVSLCRLESEGVAKITSTSDCQWAKGNMDMKAGTRLLPGEEVKLNQGLAEITFNSGAKVILQGPANLQIESAKSATLHDGRLTADVPDTMQDFRIHTSIAEILSLPIETRESKEPAGDMVREQR